MAAVGAASVLNQPTTPPIDEIVAEVTRDGQAAVDVYLDLPTRRLAAVALRDGAAAVGVTELGEVAVDAIVRRADNLREPAPDSLLYDPRSWPALSWDDVMAPTVLDLIDGASRVVVSPHGPLHLVAWPAMARDARRSN